MIRGPEHSFVGLIEEKCKHLHKLNKLDVLDSAVEQVKDLKELVTAGKAETQQLKMTVST